MEGICVVSQQESKSLRPEHSPTKSLAQLQSRFQFRRIGSNAEVSLRGITLRSSDVQEGDLFVGVRGVERHGARFADRARQNGAVAVLTDAVGAEQALPSGLPILVADDPRAILGEVCSWIYETASMTSPLFGVTGTNGKTSTVHFLEAILRQMGVVTGLSSTAERHIGDLRMVSGLTTPESTDLHALLARMREYGVGAVAVEVSAQALTRNRVDAVIFDVAGFTNLSHDHLDDYDDMQSYLEAKAGLFQPDRSRRAVVSLDSPWGAKLCQIADVPVATIVSQPGTDANWQVIVTSEEQTGVHFTLSSRDGASMNSRIPVIGRHMAANAGLAIAMLVEGGFRLADIDAALARKNGIDVYLPGRSELVSGEHGPAVFVDFGHSPDAFVNTLDAVRKVTAGRVIMIFGADGDRDASKRPAMAEAAVQGSDLLIITDYHPRFEDPASIRAALMKAAHAADPAHETIEVPDPKRAIREAVRLAREGDSILWAGPGDESYRDIQGKHVPYSARSEARNALAEAGW